MEDKDFEQFVRQQGVLIDGFVKALGTVHDEYVELDNAWKASDAKSHDEWREDHPSQTLDMKDENNVIHRGHTRKGL